MSEKAQAEIATITAKEAFQMLKSTYIVQEFVNGGSFRSLVLSQVTVPPELVPDCKNVT